MSSPFLESIREAIRLRHYSIRTERAYVDWARRFILFHNKRHPKDMGESEVASFLSHLAVNRKVAASTQNQALNALVFVYKHVLKRPLGEITDAVRAKRPARLPVVLSQNEVRQILAELRGAHWLIACLQYGSGLQIASRTSIQSPGPSIITKGPGFFQTKQQDSARMHVTRRDPFFLIESVYQYRQQHFYDRDPVA